METKSNAKLKALFIIPSITGIILFMIPVKNADGDWTVVVKILADIISGYIGGFLPLLCVLILTVSAVMSLIALAKPKFIMNSDIMKECFACKPIWVVLRVLAVIFVWLTYLGVGEDGVGLIGMITGGGQGGGRPPREGGRPAREAAPRVWQPKAPAKSDNLSFEDMMSRFKSQSEEKMADLDHETNNRRGGGYAPRSRRGR